MKIWYSIIVLIFSFCCSALAVMGQTVKIVKVKQGEPFVDHVALAPGSADHDLLIKFRFDEPDNTLTVSLMSYKKLFVFQSDVSYRTASSCHKLKPENLPYVVQSDERARYRFTKALRRSIKPKRKHIFHRWISVDGLQPRPQDFYMVNDYIEQTFDIVQNREQVTVDLRDVLLMDEEITSKKKKYELYFQKDLCRQYEIVIFRDPCLGKEQQLESVKKRAEAISSSYQSLKDNFGENGILDSPERMDAFDEMKKVLLTQYTYTDEVSRCQDIQSYIDRYNAVVDSISELHYEYVEPEEDVIELDFSAEYILNMAHQMDYNVSRWLLSDDPMERKDLLNASLKIIQELDEPIAVATTISAQQNAAIAVFRKAEAYFKRVCMKP